MNHLKKTLTILAIGAFAASPLSWAGSALDVGPIPAAALTDNVDLPSIETNTAQSLEANVVAPEDGIQVIGDIDKDYSYTPVTPCRIVDTRNAVGDFIPGERREYYVYGTAGDILPQGGNAAGCPSPQGEPRGVVLNITAVGVSGNGNFVAFPANVAPPAASLVNYKTGVQNIANTAPVKAYTLFGPKEVEFLNSFGTAHLVVDVMGYYHNPINPIGVEYNSGEQSVALTSTDATIRTISVTTPVAGSCVVNASGYFTFSSTALNVARCSITTGTTVDFSHLIISGDTGGGNNFESWGATRGYAKAAGTHTYRLVCNEAQGTVSVGDTSLTAVCTKNRY